MPLEIPVLVSSVSLALALAGAMGDESADELEIRFYSALVLPHRYRNCCHLLVEWQDCQ